MQGGSKGMFLNLYQIQRATGEQVDHAYNQAGYADELRIGIHLFKPGLLTLKFPFGFLLDEIRCQHESQKHCRYLGNDTCKRPEAE